VTTAHRTDEHCVAHQLAPEERAVSQVNNQPNQTDRGRAAEELVYRETTTGPESDLEQATSLARQMVGRWGMSDELGAVSALPRSGEESYGSGAASQRTLELIDEEVRRILTECAEDAHRTLAEHREQLEHLSEALLERETLDEADAYAVAGIVRRPATEQPVAAHA